MPQWIKQICFIWQSVEWNIDLMGDLMSRSWEIKAIHNFQPAATVIHFDDNGSHINANVFS